ncbi:MAG: hypothetical protein A7315_14150 [Candidatus Altiarchaeales archaeon WOR_SM1_79]|nr:MAG: hypothetical protein A7315_14150 [Candidatus Altiarchaeales archaeon WOR_SM1_79]
MNRKTEMNIVAVFFILLGLYFFFKEIIPAIILMTIGFGISPDVRNWLSIALKFIGLIEDKKTIKDAQNIESSPEAKQTKIGRDGNVTQINIDGDRNVIEIGEKTKGEKAKSESNSRHDRAITQDKIREIKKLYDKMAECYLIIIEYQYTGVTDEETLDEIRNKVKEFKALNLKAGSWLNEEATKSLSGTLGNFSDVAYTQFPDKISDWSFSDCFYDSKKKLKEIIGV